MSTGAFEPNLLKLKNPLFPLLLADIYSEPTPPIPIAILPTGCEYQKNPLFKSPEFTANPTLSEATSLAVINDVLLLPLAVIDPVTNKTDPSKVKFDSPFNVLAVPVAVTM